jgi:hypothetical protein
MLYILTKVTDPELEEDHYNVHGIYSVTYTTCKGLKLDA